MTSSVQTAMLAREEDYIGRDKAEESAASSSAATFDEALHEIGGCGLWQRAIFLVLSAASAASGAVVVAWSFIAFQMESTCSNPYCQSDSFDAKFAQLANPAASSKCQYVTLDGIAGPDDCDLYKSRLNNLTSESEIEYGSCSVQDMLFDNMTAMHNSLTSEFHLVCENDFTRSLVGAAYMLGMLFGSTIMGTMSDRLGRLPALMTSIALVSIAGVAQAFMYNLWFISLCRLLTGIGGIGLFMTAFVMSVEMVSHKYNTLIGVAIEIPFAIGELMFGVLAYFVRDWRLLQLISHAAVAACALIYFVAPESPRWLLAKQRHNQANAILAKMAKINGHPSSGVKQVAPSVHATKEDDTPVQSGGSALASLFRPAKVGWRTSTMCYQWFSVTLCYYGLSYASTSLSGDPYVNFMLSVSIEIPAYIFCILLMDGWGRRPILSFCQIVSGVSCICASLLTGHAELAVLQTILALVGKFGSSACFAIVYVYTAEMFPTATRNTAIGLCSTVARVGGISSMLIFSLAAIWPQLPVLLMGATATVAGILALKFPETAGLPLPETQEDALHIGDGVERKSFFSFTRR